MSSGSLDARLERFVSDDEGRLIKSRFVVVLAVCYLLFTATYVAINVFSVGRAAHTLFLPGEERLPFLPIFEYFYVLTYFIAVLLIASVRDYDTLRRLLQATGLTLLIAYTTYLFYPVYFERPHLEVTSLHTWLLSLEYKDKPYNHFPSLHVALSWLAVFASQVSRRTRAGLYLLATAISISTLFVKQHYIADVLYGFALAGSTWWYTQKVSEARSSISRWNPATARYPLAQITRADRCRRMFVQESSVCCVRERSRPFCWE